MRSVLSSNWQFHTLVHFERATFNMQYQKQMPFVSPLISTRARCVLSPARKENTQQKLTGNYFYLLSHLLSLWWEWILVKCNMMALTGDEGMLFYAHYFRYAVIFISTDCWLFFVNPIRVDRAECLGLACVQCRNSGIESASVPADWQWSSAGWIIEWIWMKLADQM